MRRLTAALIALTAVAATSPVSAQTQPRDDIYTQLRTDANTVIVNIPIWLANHLPSMMAQSGLGAGIDFDRDKMGAFSIGIVARVGIMNQFEEVGRGMELVDGEQILPALFPWPQLGITLGVGLTQGLELGGDFQFVPPMTVYSNETVSVDAELLAGSLSLRWRANEPDGAVPAFTIGIGGSYQKGSISVTGSGGSDYTFQTNAGSASGQWLMSGSPDVDWEMAQISLEARLGWVWGPIRPYFGIGFGYTFGDAHSINNMELRADIDSVNGQPVDEEPVYYDNKTVEFTAPAARLLFRPHLGLDIVAGPVAFTLQFDVGITSHEELEADLFAATEGIDPNDSGVLYGDAAKETTISATFITTFAVRLQF